MTLLEELRRRYPDISKDALYARVLHGDVLVAGECIRDPKRAVSSGINIHFKEKAPFVSRGGVKLKAAIDAWNLPISGKVFVDAGSSTGGFTDCLLQHGAELVHAVDVGTNQLDYALRRDRRVRVREKTSILHISSLDPTPHGAVCDLSFRSILKAASHITALTTERWLVALVKPQFERSHVEELASTPFDGVVDPRERSIILEDTKRRLEAEGLFVRRVMDSPIEGAGGNLEYLALITGAASGPMVN